MILALLLGGLIVAAVVVATARQYLAGRNNNGPVELGVNNSSKPRCNCL